MKKLVSIKPCVFNPQSLRAKMYATILPMYGRSYEDVYERLRVVEINYQLRRNKEYFRCSPSGWIKLFEAKFV